jgi:hypothetical protein
MTEAMTNRLPVITASCSLDADGVRAQVERYARLAASATRIHRREDVIVIGLRGDGDARLIEELIATENECCPFYRFDFRPELERLTIGVDSPEHRPALDAIAAALGAGHNR